MSTCLTPEQIETVILLRKSKLPFYVIGKQIGRSPDTIQAALDPEFRQRRLERIQRWRRENPSKKPAPAPKRTVFSLWPESAREAPVPAEVLADRDRRSDLPRTINMMLLGDPVPGRSALDRR